jgi:signal transduction histidine kinase
VLFAERVWLGVALGAFLFALSLRYHGRSPSVQPLVARYKPLLTPPYGAAQNQPTLTQQVPTVPSIAADPTQLKQALKNLIANAR